MFFESINMGLTPTDLIAAIAALVGWLLWAYERWDKVRERKGRKAAENALADNRSRAQGPLLRATRAHLVPGTNAPKIDTYQWDQGRQHEVIDPGDAFKGLPRGPSTVVVSLANDGAIVRLPAAESESGLNLAVKPTGIPKGDNCAAIWYAFNSAIVGQDQIISVNFESEQGAKLTHIYKTRHGYCELSRITPA